MSNMAFSVKRHNAKILNPQVPTAKYGCNCRIKTTCPLDEACLTPSVVYKATVATENEPPMHYIGMTEHDFKPRHRNHKLSFNNPRYAASTTLSTHIWDFIEVWERLHNQTVNCQARETLQQRLQCNRCLAE